MRKIKNLLLATLLLALGACAGGMGEDTAPGDRRVNIVNFQNGERVNAVYAHGGHYDTAVMDKIAQLFRDRQTGEVHAIDPKLIDVIYNLLSALALPDTTQIELTSGYRTPSHQAELAQRDENAARKSLHTTGQAADIRIPGVKGKAIGAVAKTLQEGGVSYYPKTGHIHVDVGAIRSWEPK